jgi:hypothetical protein
MVTAVVFGQLGLALHICIGRDLRARELDKRNPVLPTRLPCGRSKQSARECYL